VLAPGRWRSPRPEKVARARSKGAQGTAAIRCVSARRSPSTDGPRSDTASRRHPSDDFMPEPRRPGLNSQVSGSQPRVSDAVVQVRGLRPCMNPRKHGQQEPNPPAGYWPHVLNKSESAQQPTQRAPHAAPPLAEVPFQPPRAGEEFSHWSGPIVRRDCARRTPLPGQSRGLLYRPAATLSQPRPAAAPPQLTTTSSSYAKSHCDTQPFRRR